MHRAVAAVVLAGGRRRHHGEAQHLAPPVGVAVGTVGLEQHRRPGRHDVVDAVDRQGERALLRRAASPGCRAGGPGTGRRRRASCASPTARGARAGRCRPAAGRRCPACRATARPPRPAPTSRTAGDWPSSTSGGQRHAERLGDAAQRADARVRAVLLDLHEHALAHARPTGQLVEGPALLGAHGPHVAGDGGDGGGRGVGALGRRLWLAMVIAILTDPVVTNTLIVGAPTVAMTCLLYRPRPSSRPNAPEHPP